MMIKRFEQFVKDGSFRVKGDILEIHPSYEQFIVRVSFFGDYIEKIEKLTEADWHRAYPGNDPRSASQALKKTIDAISFNLNLAVNK